MLVVIEVGTHSPWVSRLLEDCGHEVIVANAPAEMIYYTLSGPETGYSYAIPMASMADFMKMNEQVDAVNRGH